MANFCYIFILTPLAAIACNFQSSVFLVLHAAPEHILTHISRVFEERAMYICTPGKCGTANRTKHINIGRSNEIFQFLTKINMYTSLKKIHYNCIVEKKKELWFKQLLRRFKLLEEEREVEFRSGEVVKFYQSFFFFERECVCVCVLYN